MWDDCLFVLTLGKTHPVLQWKKKKMEKSQTGDDKECKSGSASQKFSWLLWKCLSLYYAPEISCWSLPKHSCTIALWNKSIQKPSLWGHLFFQSYFCFPDLCFEEVSLLRSLSRKIWASPCLQNYVVFRPPYGTCQTRLCVFSDGTLLSSELRAEFFWRLLLAKVHQCWWF